MSCTSPDDTEDSCQETPGHLLATTRPGSHHLALHLLAHLDRVQGEGHQVSPAGRHPRSEAVCQQAGGALDTRQSVMSVMSVMSVVSVTSVMSVMSPISRGDHLVLELMIDFHL